MNENYIIKNANEFSSIEKEKFKQIVLSKGEVSDITFDRLLNKNPILLFYPNAKKPIAIGALKLPNSTYKVKVFKKSGSDLKPNDFEYELGWIVSLEQGKGIGKFITKLLFDHMPNIYSTVRTENTGMNKIMNSIGFDKTGNPYKSERGNYTNYLYIKSK